MNIKILTNSIKVLKKSPIEFALIGIITLTITYVAMPINANASMDMDKANEGLALELSAFHNELLPYGVLPKSETREPAYKITVPATAYNSLESQTDSTPNITASGTTTRHGVLAANFLPIGTRVKIPQIYGEDVFIVEDRMNPRYNKRIDIWMEDYDDAIQFGYKNLEIEVYPNK
jgi:3D (Asp-Asp-Asp) domain-containing protein